MYELDWMDLPESPTAVATVAVVPTARLNIPKLNNIEMLYDWIDDVRRYVVLAEQATPPTEMATKLLLSIATKEDATLVDFKTLLTAFRAPRMVEDSVSTQVVDDTTKVFRDRTNEELLAAVKSQAYEGKTRVGKEVTGTYTVVQRLEMVWEWLEAFVEDVYLDEARVNHYTDLLAESYIVLPPLREGLPAANSALNAHVVKIKMLLRLSKTRGLTAKKRALVSSFKKDAHLYREATRGNNWDGILQYVRRELDSRVSAYQMGHVPAVQAVTKKKEEKATEPVKQGPPTESSPVSQQALILALQSLGYGPPSQRDQTGAQGGAQRGRFKMNRGRGAASRDRAGRRGPYQGRSSGSNPPARSTNTAPNARPAPEGTCHWCDQRGHGIATCQSKQAGRPSVFPPKPHGIGWNEHKAAHPVRVD